MVLVLLPKESFPDADPVVVGVKTTANDTLWPEGMVTGNETPEIENTPLLLAADVTVTAPPEAVSDEVCVPVVPRMTEPKFRDPGVTLNVPPAVVAVPVPLSGMFT